MKREEALSLLKEKIKNQNLIKHSLAVEAIMKELAIFFKEDSEKWALAGLLHDIDYEITKDQPEKHSLMAEEILSPFNLDREIILAIKKHNPFHQLPLQSLIEKALYISDPVSGLIVASVLVLPSKKIQDLTVNNILNRFKEKSFAKGANRQIISQSENLLGLSLEKLFSFALKAMQNISQDLDL
ncbi:MAG: HD domain-containing protein [Candidatus Paceibacterota bacterium]